MARCLRCMSKVSILASVCPHCLRDIRGQIFIYLALYFFIGLFVLGLIVWIVQMVIAVLLWLWAAFLVMLQVLGVCAVLFVLWTIFRYLFLRKKGVRYTKIFMDNFMFILHPFKKLWRAVHR